MVDLVDKADGFAVLYLAEKRELLKVLTRADISLLRVAENQING